VPSTSATAVTVAQNVRQCVPTVTKNVLTAQMKKYAEAVTFARTVQEETEAFATIVRPVSIVPSTSAIAEAVARNVRPFALIVMKNVQTAQMKKYAEAVTFARTVSEETETSAITARPV